jgi:glycoside/pentoside/hexuronide:cation symporter, GPH family
MRGAPLRRDSSRPIKPLKLFVRLDAGRASGVNPRHIMANPAPAIVPSVPLAALDPPAETAAQALRRHPLGLGLLGFYGAGAIVDAAATVFLGTFLYFYLTAVCGLSGTLAGLALGIALAVDSFVDPLVGSLSDNSRSRFGRRHPFMLAAVVPIMVCLGLLFSVPSGLRGPGLFAYVLVLCLGLRVGLSAFNVPYIALGGELSDNYNERSTIVAFRVGVGAIGTVAALVLGYGVFLSAKAGGQLHRAGYAPLAWSGGAVMAAAALLSTASTLKARARLHGATPGEGAAIVRLYREMGEVFRNSSFLFLFGACLVTFVGFGAAGALTLHANTFFWRLPPQIILVISLSGIPGVLIGIAVAGVLARMVEKRTIAIVGLCLIAVGQFSPVTLRLSGVLPPAGTAPVALLIGAVMLASVGVAMALVGFQSMMADAADEHDLMFGARREGLYFAGISFAAKASSGLGVVIAGLAADTIGFPNDLAARGAHASVPWAKAVELALIYGPGASVITVLGLLLLLGYRIDRAAHGRIIDALAVRRTG